MLLSLSLTLIFSLTSFAQDAAAPAAPEAAAPAATAGGDPVKGKELFNANCAACHKLDAKSTGPALRGVASKHDMAWIYKWVHNSSDMIKSGDPVAVKLFEENNKSVMTSFPQLAEADIDNIIAYTSEVKAEPAAGAPGSASPPGTKVEEGGISNNIILGALALVMAILVVMLVMVNKVLTKVASKNGIEIPTREAKTPIWKAFAKNQFLVLVSSIFLLLASGYFVYAFLMQVGVDQNYEPIQPIHYSHKIHAGDNEINCKYCHSAARVSKNAGIPSLNVCMNCHKTMSEFQGDKDSTYVEYSKEFYTAEIQKLYDAVGWDKA
ncbi:MAG TPA: c-type cytochrome, partial [Flavobacterium sp.]|nr:c-type cytochrome [Flavobacterium sp.]